MSGPMWNWPGEHCILLALSRQGKSPQSKLKDFTSEVITRNVILFLRFSFKSLIFGTFFNGLDMT